MKIGTTNLSFIEVIKGLVILSFVLVFLSACGIYFFERDIQPKVFGSVLNSITYTILLYTTIGFSNITPVTIGGKMISLAVTTLATIIGLLFLVYIIIGAIRTCSKIRRITKKHFG
ncbi:hypothetical protein JT359_06600 [Candidatus Poribacteria bacterium]|nr:hypothetical protein [Candidatus Poribacteria bacterium]